MAYRYGALVTIEGGPRTTQIVVINSDGTGLQQLTHRFPGHNGFSRVRLSGDGTLVAFDSSDNPTRSNRDRSREIFVVTVPETLR